MEQRVSNGSSISILSSPFMHPIKILSFEGREKDKKRKEEQRKKERKNERILSKIFCTVLVMMDKKEREREKAPRRGQAWSYLVLSELGRFYRHAANRSLKTLQGSTSGEEIGIDIYIYDPARQNSQLQESVRISTWRAFFGVEVAHSAREEAGKGWIDACTALHRPVSSREPASNPFIRSARRAWRMDGKSSVGNRVTGCKVMDTATTEFLRLPRTSAHSQESVLFPPLPPSHSSLLSASPPFFTRPSPTTTFSPSATFQVAPILRRPIPPATRHRTWHAQQARKLAALKPIHLNPIVLLPRLRHLSRSGVPSFRFPSATVISLASRESSRVQLLRGLA